MGKFAENLNLGKRVLPPSPYYRDVRAHHEVLGRELICALLRLTWAVTLQATQPTSALTYFLQNICLTIHLWQMPIEMSSVHEIENNRYWYLIIKFHCLNNICFCLFFDCMILFLYSFIHSFIHLWIHSNVVNT